MPILDRATLYRDGYLDGDQGDLNGDALVPTDGYFQKFTEKLLRLRQKDFIYERWLMKKTLPAKFGNKHTWHRLEPATPAGPDNALGDNIDSGRSLAMFGKRLSASVEWYGVYFAVNDKADAYITTNYYSTYMSELSVNLAETKDIFAREYYLQFANYVYEGGHDTAADILITDTISLETMEAIVHDFQEYKELRPDTNTVNNTNASDYYDAANFVPHPAPREGFGGSYPVIMSTRSLKALQMDPKYREFKITGISDKVSNGTNFSGGDKWEFQDLDFYQTRNYTRIPAGGDIEGSTTTVETEISIMPTKDAIAWIGFGGLGAQMIVHGKGSAGVNDPLNRVHATFGWKSAWGAAPNIFNGVTAYVYATGS